MARIRGPFGRIPAFAAAAVWSALVGTFVGQVGPGTWKAEGAMADAEDALRARPPAYEARRLLMNGPRTPTSSAPARGSPSRRSSIRSGTLGGRSTTTSGGEDPDRDVQGNRAPPPRRLVGPPPRTRG